MRNKGQNWVWNSWVKWPIVAIFQSNFVARIGSITRLVIIAWKPFAQPYPTRFISTWFPRWLICCVPWLFSVHLTKKRNPVVACEHKTNAYKSLNKMIECSNCQPFNESSYKLIDHKCCTNKFYRPFTQMLQLLWALPNTPSSQTLT